MSDGSVYAPGSEEELERLQLQARCLEGLTRRLIRECGIGPGMRVLDIGAGPGDVAFLVAEAVGSSGYVIGVDREPRSIELAKRRGAEAGLANVEFIVADDDALPTKTPFDAAIGRFVLIHQADPVAMIRRAAAVVRSKGVVAFLEPAVHIDGSSVPELELLRAAAGSIKRFMMAVLPSPDVAGRMTTCFTEAGLPEPNVLWESVVPGSKGEMWLRSFIVGYKNFLPLMQRLGVVDPRVGDPETLAGRIIAEAASTRAQSVTAPFASAWAVKP